MLDTFKPDCNANHSCEDLDARPVVIRLHLSIDGIISSIVFARARAWLLGAWRRGWPVIGIGNRRCRIWVPLRHVIPLSVRPLVRCVRILRSGASTRRLRPGAPHIAYFAMCGFGLPPEYVELTITLRRPTHLALVLEILPQATIGFGVRTHTFAKCANVWGTRLLHSPDAQDGNSSGEDLIIVGKNRNGARGPIPVSSTAPI